MNRITWKLAALDRTKNFIRMYIWLSASMQQYISFCALSISTNWDNCFYFLACLTDYSAARLEVGCLISGTTARSCPSTRFPITHSLGHLKNFLFIQFMQHLCALQHEIPIKLWKIFGMLIRLSTLIWIKYVHWYNACVKSAAGINIPIIRNGASVLAN